MGPLLVLQFDGDCWWREEETRVLDVWTQPWGLRLGAADRSRQGPDCVDPGGSGRKDLDPRLQASVRWRWRPRGVGPWRRWRLGVASPVLRRGLPEVQGLRAALGRPSGRTGPLWAWSCGAGAGEGACGDWYLLACVAGPLSPRRDAAGGQAACCMGPLAARSGPGVGVRSVGWRLGAGA